MIKRTLHFLWCKKFFLLFLALAVILLPNTIGRDFQVRTTTVITEMTIEKQDDNITITAKKFKPASGSESTNYETVTYEGTDVREMLADVSLAHCTEIKFNGETDVDILHELYHYQDLRGNTKVNDTTIGELLRSQNYHYQ